MLATRQSHGRLMVLIDLVVHIVITIIIVLIVKRVSTLGFAFLSPLKIVLAEGVIRYRIWLSPRCNWLF